MNNPLVSILCTTYNHEQFIARALDSFLSQKTQYSFEVIIHDDASTDETLAIIKNYAQKNPDLIKLFVETKNQYLSTGYHGEFPAAATAASGDYLALCEGDDFWIDDGKLEKQISYMETHPACTFCFTNAMLFDNQTQLFTRKMLPWPKSNSDRLILDKSKILTTEDMLRISFPPTASFFFRKRDYDRRPEFSREAFSGDKYLQLVMTEMGYAYYLDEVTTAYRVNNSASMMSQWSASNEAAAKSCQQYACLYREFNEYTNGKYFSVLAPLQIEREYGALVAMGDVGNLKKSQYKSFARHKGVSGYLKYVFLCAFPKIYLWLRMLKRYLRS